ncbi:hypothetical protein ScPMuIL_002433 [Solemya velum]
MESIDVEDESILTSMFKDAFPESWQENADFVHYLSQLSSFGVDKLAQEPYRISEEKSQILDETQGLAFKHYKTFIQTAECSREIFQDYQVIEHHVESLLDRLPPFSEECSRVMKLAQEISTNRRLNTLTLQKHTQLLEILEMPQLMDTCVRNGYYEEALELTAHVKRLEKKHSSIPVIESIVHEVRNSTQLMLKQLIQQLRTDIQLPACLRVIGFLRRMDVFTEAELRIKFLQARDAWFQTILHAVPKEDPYTHINKTIEASRVHLFDIITQYRAIFSDEDPLLVMTSDDSLRESALFHGWVVRKVTQFLTTLETDLLCGVGSRLDSILGQCMYFGLSFSRVGADFRGLLAPIFQRAALHGFTSALTEANRMFEENMRSYCLLGTTSTVGGLSYSATTQSSQAYPPTVLLDYHPLAAYCNSVLCAFNDLRLCAPVALAVDVARKLEASFCDVNRVILAFHRAEETTFDQRELKQFEEFCYVYANNLLPYMNRCLQVLYPPAQLAQILGISVTDLAKTGNIGLMNVESILESVKHLVPEREVEVPPVADDSQTEPDSTATEPDSTATEPDSTATEPDSTATEPDSTSGVMSESTESVGLVMKDIAPENEIDIDKNVENTATEDASDIPTINSEKSEPQLSDIQSSESETVGMESSLGTDTRETTDSFLQESQDQSA